MSPRTPPGAWCCKHHETTPPLAPARRAPCARRWLGWAAAIIALACTRPATAEDTFELFAASSRSGGMAGATAAVGEDFAAAHANPASLAFAPRPTFGYGLLYTRPSVKFGGNEQAQGGQLGHLLGFGTPIGEYLAFGSVIYLPATSLVSVRIPAPDTPRSLRFHDSATGLGSALAVALRPVPWLALGFGAELTMHAAVSIFSGADLGTSVTLSDTGADPAHPFSSEVKVVPRRRLAGALALEPLENLRLSFHYRQESILEIRLPYEARFSLTRGGETLPLRYELTSRFGFRPREAAWGAAYRPEPGILTCLSLHYFDYSSYTRAFYVDAEPLKGLDLNKLSADGKHFQGSDPPKSFGFHDIVVPRAGLEYAFAPGGSPESFAAFLRLGYMYEPSPVPPGELVEIDNDRHTITWGFGVMATEPFITQRTLHFDIHVGYTHLVEQEFPRQSPADAFDDFTASGHIWAASFQIGSTL